MAYETTNVAVEKSQSEVRKLLAQFGAREFQFGEGRGIDEQKWAGVSFRHEGHTVMMQAPLKAPSESEQKGLQAKARRAHTRTLADIEAEYWEQEARRIWRVLFWSLKARMVAVEEGVEEFEQAFLAHLVDPRTGITLWQHVSPAIHAGQFRLGGEGLRALGAGSDAVDESEIVVMEDLGGGWRVTVLDVGPVNIRGAVRGSRVRVVWSNGTLHVVRSMTNVERLTTLSEPVESRGTWTVETENGEVSFTRRGCPSCGYRLGSVSMESILG